MLTASNIDDKITNLLPGLSTEQKKAVLTVVKAFSQDRETSILEEEYTKEMEKRFSDYETGQVKGYTIEETIKAAKKLLKAKQKK